MTSAASKIQEAIRSDTPTLAVESFTTTVGPYRIAPFPRGASDTIRSVPVATLLKLKRQLREERQLRTQAEAERDQLKATLRDVLDGVRNGEREK